MQTSNRTFKIPDEAWRSRMSKLDIGHVTKGGYQNSISPQSHEGMNKRWFASIGLFDMCAFFVQK